MNRKCLRYSLTFTDTKYLGAAGRTNTLGCRSFVFQGDGFGIFDINLFSAFHAIGLHSSLLDQKISVVDYHLSAEESRPAGQHFPATM